MEFYSHPDKLLREHLVEVAREMERAIQASPALGGARLDLCGRLLAYCHDFGKYTSFFQDYLLRKKEHGTLHHHGFISAVFAAYQAGKGNFVSGEVFRGTTGQDYFPLVAYFVVLHHHGALGLVEEEVVRERELEGDFSNISNVSLRPRLKVALEQAKDLKVHADEIEAEYQESCGLSGVREFLDQWIQVFGGLHRLCYWLMNKELAEFRQGLFYKILYLYSLLIDADKRSAGGTASTRRLSLPPDLVDRYRRQVFGLDATGDGRQSEPEAEIKQMNQIRERLYHLATTNLIQALEGEAEPHLFTLTAPTGSGKTLTGFSVALKLRHWVEQHHGYSPRIIYCLPFTSIIDQNYGVIEEVLGMLPDFEANRSAYLIKHHHLSDVFYTEDGKERALDEAMLLVESWESEIVISTFIQFFYAIIGYRNRALKKLHNIAGSIVILDEVQSVKLEYWDLIGYALKLITKELGCYVLVMTATRPLLFAPGEAVELTGESETTRGLFSGLDRVELLCRTEKEIAIEDLLEEFKAIYQPGHSYLLVFNTINSSLNAYRQIRDMLAGDPTAEVFYLSTNIIPKERLSRVEEIKRRVGG
ncbi:MAG: CRISPR-associated endonuclease Cas3'', partial [Clostridia bacterium]|nr:CRISPR-associated endonuclease Cas3'' [Clostridia bacterium]